ncbi:LCP family protein [Enemella evansiae]|uniref:LCP family protein n=1 Tax=Enemella evansiae TaxID=2016499 RepID=UPI0010D7DB4E|nr:LCP family protein [Enemella evansiae]TDO91479.1 LytR family transcriptional attenuator [Enemella evansiae]
MSTLGSRSEASAGSTAYVPGGTTHAFRRSALWTAIGTYLPGLGLARAGRRRTGAIILGVFLAVIAGLLIWALVDSRSLLTLAINTAFLKTMVIVLPLIALVWAGVVVVTHLLLRPRRLTNLQRGLGAGLVGVLCFTVTAPMAVAARYSFDQSQLVDTIFRRGDSIRSGTAPGLDTVDPWRNKPRVNLLLLGGDAGKDRTGTRTDTVIVASIDTRTGDTVLISLPRNTARMPFPANSPLSQYYPDGFTSGDADDQEFMLNSIYDNVPQNVPADVLGPTDDLGADALKLSVGEATGLKIDYYVLVQLEGFHKLVDALGGVTVNINTWIAIGGQTDLGIKPKGALRPGPNQHLNGDQALWYARGRYGSDDFQRMDRQRCVIDAVIKQANPANMLTRYEAVARQSKDIVKTDMPQEILPAMVDLSLRVKNGGKTRSIVLKHGQDGFLSNRPDFELIRQRVATATKPRPAPTTPPPAPQTQAPGAPAPQPPTSQAPRTEAPVTQAPTTQAPASQTPSRRASTPAQGSGSATTPSAAPSTATAPAEDLSDSCAYKPEIAEQQPPVPPWEQ